MFIADCVRRLGGGGYRRLAARIVWYTMRWPSSRYVQWLWDWLLGLDHFSFEWDAGNSTKSLRKHGATCQEAEAVFREREFVPLGEQYKPPSAEPRFAVLGKPAGGKLLFVVFTIRKQFIRVISARPMNDKERKFYASLREK